MATVTEINKIFKGLSNEGAQNHSRTGVVRIKISATASTMVHVCAKFFPWDKKPKYYACRFFSGSNFFDCTSKSLMPLYNKKNKDKIQEFKTLEALVKFIDN